MLLFLRLIPLHKASYFWNQRLLCAAAGRDNQQASTTVTSLLESLRQCSRSRSLAQGRTIHAKAIESGHHTDLFVATTLIDMYAKCGSLVDARQVFDQMPERTIVSWNVLILGYVGNGQSELALELFANLEPSPNSGTFVAAALACSDLASVEETVYVEGRPVKSRCLDRAILIHSQARRSGFSRDVYLGSAIVDMYSKCGSMIRAREVFDSMVDRNTVTWNALILGYAVNGQPEQALWMFSAMASDVRGEASSRTIVVVLVACSGLAVAEAATVEDGQPLKRRSLERGMAVHRQAVESGCCDNVFVGNSLVDMYAKCGSMVDSRSAFDRMARHSSVSWNSLLLGYATNGESRLSLELFSWIESSGGGVEIDERTCVAALMACAKLAELEEPREVGGRMVKPDSLSRGMAIHGVAVRGKLCGDMDVFVASSLVDMYVKCGSMADARKVFEGIARLDVVLWTALILGYVENGESELGLKLFRRMRSTGCSPTGKTYDAALMACGNLLALQAGKNFHTEINRVGLEDETSACLVSFYGRCGAMTDCEEVFSSSPRCYKETVAWNSLIGGYSQQGDASKSLQLFSEMQSQSLRVTGRTLASVLAACSHAGLVDEGKRLFDELQSRFGIAPSLEHFNCVVDMLGRANRLEEAVEMAETMPVKPDAITWTSVLAASYKWNNLVAARRAFECLDVRDAAACLLLANIYSAVGMWEARAEVLSGVTER